MAQTRSLLLLLALFTATTINVVAQSLEKDLEPFTRIIASPHINLILNEGNTESIRIQYNRIDADKINVQVKGKTLRIFLDDAKVTDKLERVSPHQKRSVYEDASITAYVTYKKLDKLQIRGNQELTCNSPITSEKFKLKAYGENEINLDKVETSFLKTHLYGDNRLRISGGKAEYQKHKLYGDNRVDASRLKSFSASATSFGDSEIDLNSQDELRVTAFGESKVYFSGNAYVSKGLIIGRTEIQRNN